ncbi:hypothetical protein P170DRAFT_139099 [Aspergillus steynii IBT 23096]|uniref:Transcription factor domain-containing protein n=1 Tax=Aspergillus steynii IBT 23096 TaxID=1392250 RepID=A0A2I2GBH9_9EURO|nr:uncharacterized protein P170DRAFT_139099 [Aspergillus steynii IBT 23096]PLB50215.1 hypothetical protein P170DRAFT_139099 [Aspergillus steynii IBT 23096]
MDENETDPSFVVIMGNPQQGKGERISQVRSHITKQRHRQNGRRQASAPKTLALMSPHSEIHSTLVPSGLSIAGIGHQRMQSFLGRYLCYSHDVHPSFHIVVLAAATHAPLMSAKILTASTWDDLNNTGEISNLTLKQGVITRRLIIGSLSNIHEASSDVNIAALVSILIFDVRQISLTRAGNADIVMPQLVSEDRNAFFHHKQALHELIYMRGGMQALGFEGHLAKSMPLIEQFQKIVKIATPACYYRQSSGIFPTLCQPLDLKIFTFPIQHQNTSPESTSPFLAMLLGHLSRLLLLVRECTSQSFPAKTQRCLGQCATIYRDLIATRPLIANDIDVRAIAILHATLLFSWSGFAFNDVGLVYWSDSLNALQTSLRQPDIDQTWAHLPGALIWCLVIGARLAQLGSARKWFMMQLVRVASCIALDWFDEVLQSLQLIVNGLDAAEMLDNMPVLYGSI